MKIQEYEFGKIKINNRTYTQDLILSTTRVYERWWRREGHSLCLEDLEIVLQEKPKILIIGTGYNGMLKVPSQLSQKLKEMGLKVVVRPTKTAVQKFNELVEKEKVCAALHLTC